MATFLFSIFSYAFNDSLLFDENESREKRETYLFCLIFFEY